MKGTDFPKRNYTNLDEKQYLIPLSRRHAIYYLEKCKIIRHRNDVRFLTQLNNENFEISLPVANIGALLLGSGCSITSEAARIITSRGCLIGITGGGGSPLFLISSQHRSPLSKIRQYNNSFSEERRLECAKILFLRRKKLIEKFPEFDLPLFPSPENYLNINELNAAEGAWAKRAYRALSNRYKIPWEGKKAEDKKRENPITFLNFLTYSIADIAIYHLGYDPNIGILHGRTKGGGLAYDLADVVKPILALVPSFEANYRLKNLNQIKESFISDLVRYDLLDYLVKTLEEMFDIEKQNIGK